MRQRSDLHLGAARQSSAALTESVTNVFDDHRFCAEREPEVAVMRAPHRHSQFEINHIISGELTYWFNGCEITLQRGQTALFWGMVPHRSAACSIGTTFVCLYVPASTFVSLQIGEALRLVLFRGDLVRAQRALETDQASFLRWRDDLLSHDAKLETIVRDELSARLRRIDLDGWLNMFESAPPSRGRRSSEITPTHKLEQMARFVFEHSGDAIRVADVAACVGLHPNYAMSMFRKALGMTIGEYITRNRLDNAQTQLLSSNGDIAGIAFASGFGSLSQFYEAFKARFGVSPARFRRAKGQTTARPSAHQQAGATYPPS